MVDVRQKLFDINSMTFVNDYGIETQFNFEWAQCQRQNTNFAVCGEFALGSTDISKIKRDGRLRGIGRTVGIDDIQPCDIEFEFRVAPKYTWEFNGRTITFGFMIIDSPVDNYIRAIEKGKQKSMYVLELSREEMTAIQTALTLAERESTESKQLFHDLFNKTIEIII